MTLDSDTCYRAVAARDPRFDGRFFTGVTSTGVYCRPICPSRTPARKNTRLAGQRPPDVSSPRANGGRFDRYLSVRRGV
jgi:hypothetical protein